MVFMLGSERRIIIIIILVISWLFVIIIFLVHNSINTAPVASVGADLVQLRSCLAHNECTTLSLRQDTQFHVYTLYLPHVSTIRIPGGSNHSQYTNWSWIQPLFVVIIPPNHSGFGSHLSYGPLIQWTSSSPVGGQHRRNVIHLGNITPFPIITVQRPSLHRIQKPICTYKNIICPWSTRRQCRQKSALNATFRRREWSFT